jgi:hypothetical protein
VPEANAVRSPAGRWAASTRQAALGAAVVAGVTVIVYGRGLAAGFVGDDFMILHRLRQLSGPGDVLSFFGAEFFEYYRPLGFVAHALDYAVAGADPRQYHLTNLLLHVINSVLVLLIGRRLSPDSLAGPAAALLFALHASNHEAVMWISARFDLLATTFSLAALWLMSRRDGPLTLAPVLFGLAVLSKESAVALPLAAAGWSVFFLRSSTRDTVRRVVPWLVALAVCALMRQVGGGLPAAGGAGRIPKLIVFGTLMAAIVALGDQRWLALRERMRGARAAVVVGAGIALAAAAAAAAFWNPGPGRLAAEKLAVAGFALFHLVSPIIEISETPFYLNPSSRMYWAAGVLAISLMAVIALALWRRLVDDDRSWFLATFLIATLLPVSALTEGKRYLYLPSAAVSLWIGLLAAELSATWRRVALAAIAIGLAVSVLEINGKIRDWTWAGAMTAQGADLVDGTLAPSCGAGHVVFLTSPVGIRGVYTHFYYETLELGRGCMPAVFQVLARVMRIDTTVEVRWEGPDRIVMTTEQYQGNFVLSDDLRHFDRPLAKYSSQRLETPLGLLVAGPFGADGVRLELTLSPSLRGKAPLFFYYSAGRIQPIPAARQRGSAAGAGPGTPQDAGMK